LGFWEGCKVIGCYAPFDLKIIPHPHLRKIKQIASPKSLHGGEGAAFYSAPRPSTPHPQLRKITCSLQIALVEKAAWWAARCHKPLSKLLFVKILNCETASIVKKTDMHKIKEVVKP